MLPNMNSRQMQRMMKQMGVQQQSIAADRVEIISDGKKIVVEPCEVMKVNMMGQMTWQVVGEAREESLDTAPSISDDDVETVMSQANVSREKALEAIEAADGDLAAAIMNLSE